MTEPSLRSDVRPDLSPTPPDLWRNEIHARVAGYRKRSGRRIEGAFSMRFAFPPAESLTSTAIGLEDREDKPPAARPEKLQESDVATSPAVLLSGASAAAAPPSSGPHLQALTEDLSETAAAADAPATSLLPDLVAAPEPLSAPLLPSRPGRGKRKVIAFPRPPSPPQDPYRLADPITPEQPRILDVPEELQAYSTTPLLDGLQLLSDPQIAAAPPPDHIELPFQAANVARRLYAGLLDCGLVLIAAAGFAAAAYRVLPRLSPGRPVMIAAAAILALLWAAYQYLFTMYSDATPGMRALHLHLSTFKGGRLSLRRRRSRVLGLYFSTASLIMGLLWALVDVDALCWHDRISRTYVARLE